MGLLKTGAEEPGLSLFSYDITLITGILPPLLWTNLPWAAAVLSFQNTEVSLTSASL